MNATYVPVVHGATLDRPDEVDTAETAAAVAEALSRLGYATEVIAFDLDFAWLKAFAERAPLAVFNMVEALHGNAVAAALMPAMLDRLGLAYTGARTDAYCATLSKTAMKARLLSAGIGVPERIEARAAGNEAMAIVKSDTEHASVGLDGASVVPGAAVAEEIRRRENRFGGRFFAEAFIDGREFNVAVLEDAGHPRVLPIQEIVFDTLPAGRPRIVDYEAKWEPGSDGYVNTPRAFGLEAREPEIAARLGAVACRCWDLFGLSGYARVDFRWGDDGIPYVLEVNANPCLAADAGFMATAAVAGLDYDAVIAHIVAIAGHPRSGGQ